MTEIIHGTPPRLYRWTTSWCGMWGGRLATLGEVVTCKKCHRIMRAYRSRANIGRATKEGDKNE